MNHDDFALQVFTVSLAVALIASVVVLTRRIITSLFLLGQLLGSFKRAMLRVREALENTFKDLQHRNPDKMATT